MDGPGPLPERAIQGFVIYLSFSFLFVLYVLWAFIPNQVLHYFGFFYYPDKAWAVAIPGSIVLAAPGILIAYALINLFICRKPEDISTVRGTTRPQISLDHVEKHVNKSASEDVANQLQLLADSLSREAIPIGRQSGIRPIADLDICVVNRALYLESENENS